MPCRLEGLLVFHVGIAAKVTLHAELAKEEARSKISLLLSDGGCDGGMLSSGLGRRSPQGLRFLSGRLRACVHRTSTWRGVRQLGVVSGRLRSSSFDVANGWGPSGRRSSNLGKCAKKFGCEASLEISCG